MRSAEHSHDHARNFSIEWRTSSARISSMTAYDHNRQYCDLNSMGLYTAVKKHIALRYGKKVRAMELSNREYIHRFQRLAKANNLRPPPSAEIHIMTGYLVVRKLGLPQQYETWIPSMAFEDLYKKDDTAESAQLTTPSISSGKLSAA